MINRRRYALRESMQGDNYIIPTSRAKNIPNRIYSKLCDLGMLVNLKRGIDDFPMPWDADFVIKGQDLVLDGGAGPSGFGRCVTTIPVRSVNQFIEFNWYGPELDPELVDELGALGWDYVIK